MLIPSTHSNPPSVDWISGLKKTVKEFKLWICTEQALIWTKYCKNPQNKNKLVCIQIAEVFFNVLLIKTLKIYPHELIAGNFTSKRVGSEILPELLGVAVMEDLFKFSRRKTSLLQISAKATWDLLHILPYWLFRFLGMRAYTSPFTKVFKMLSHYGSYFYVMNETGGIAHTIPDYEKLLRVGTDGILAEVMEKQAPA
jgi:formate C-acetyltransferase